VKIGLSFSRCLRDIVESRVQFDDVLVIVARTNFDPHVDAQWNQIWDGYRFGGWSNPEWSDAEPGTDEEEVSAMYRNVAIQLYDYGKLHQPRQYSYGHVSRMPYHWLDTVVTEDELKNNPAVKDAWDRYQVIAGLSR